MTNNNNPQSDNPTISIQSTSNHQIPTKFDDTAPTNIIDYRKDPVTARKLFDIRSHLLLNTTLDATEV
ncbi:unnamed protein product [Adineta ricciae]|uniref:Uncharacterized protein n=1 Tax=Adineta ricciae TaxID=249248 RepID=A0A815BJY5_ADIRI|nr:unnamed protein product [Adineta ricciae]